MAFLKPGTPLVWEVMMGLFLERYPDGRIAIDAGYVDPDFPDVDQHEYLTIPDFKGKPFILNTIAFAPTPDNPDPGEPVALSTVMSAAIFRLMDGVPEIPEVLDGTGWSDGVNDEYFFRINGLVLDLDGNFVPDPVVTKHPIWLPRSFITQTFVSEVGSSAIVESFETIQQYNFDHPGEYVCAFVRTYDYNLDDPDHPIDERCLCIIGTREE